jgi:hypothetical protein
MRDAGVGDTRVLVVSRLEFRENSPPMRMRLVADCSISPPNSFYERTLPGRTLVEEYEARNRRYEEEYEAEFVDVVFYPSGVVTQVEISRPRSYEEESRPVACANCENYHGKTYGGTELVCAMHPYGPDDNQCVDWSST